MADIFSGSEIIELGIQIEINGRDFYRALKGKAADIKLRRVFDFLSGEEEKHIKIFQEILKDFFPDANAMAGFDEYFAYMNSLAKSYVFTRKDAGEKAAREIKDERDGIKKAMGFEKESIAFYEGMKKIVPEKEGSSVDLLISQEKIHLRQLEEIFNEIQKGK